MSVKKLVILIFAFNEESTICKVIHHIPSIKNIKNEIIVVNDGSIDKTEKNAKKAGARVINNPRNLGLGYSFKRGLLEGLKKKGEIFAILDADGQYKSRDLKKVVQKLLKGNLNLVVGNRIFGTYEYEEKLFKKCGNYLLSFFISKILLHQKELFDSQSSFRVFDRDLAKFLIKNLRAGYNYAQEMLILAILNNFRVDQIPIKCYERKIGESKLINNVFFHLGKIIWSSIKSILKNC
ncbi:MAG: glycosyltransferase [Candidatus Lokiarchaeota archaeon]|nr:glycosyltransferase [Candidatus Lokiarchaeota archaeon]